MTSRRIDTQILWIVLFAAAFWVMAWKHDIVTDLMHRALLALHSQQ